MSKYKHRRGLSNSNTRWIIWSEHPNDPDKAKSIWVSCKVVILSIPVIILVGLSLYFLYIFAFRIRWCRSWVVPFSSPANYGNYHPIGLSFVTPQFSQWKDVCEPTLCLCLCLWYLRRHSQKSRFIQIQVSQSDTKIQKYTISFLLGIDNRRWSGFIFVQNNGLVATRRSFGK